MKQLRTKNINTKRYWDSHQTATDFGIRQQMYRELAGRGISVVELGCGLSPYLAKSEFPDPWGVDFSPKTIEEAQKRFPNVGYVCASALDTGFEDKSFDVSVAGELIEHLTKPEDLIKEMVRITRKRIIISTPHLEFDDPEHLWEFDPEDLRKLLSPYGKVKTEVIKSRRFPGREYIFAVCELS